MVLNDETPNNGEPDTREILKKKRNYTSTNKEIPIELSNLAFHLSLILVLHKFINF